MTLSKVFLATTALEEFWDSSYKIIFLTKGCKRYSRQKVWQNIESETLPSYYDEKSGRQTYLYLNELSDRLLVVLQKRLNTVHGTDFSLRYWRIVLGMWLIYYLHMMYDRYSNLKNFIGLYPDFTSLCLNKECFIIPKDYSSFDKLIFADDYNLQLYSNILYWLGYKLPTKKLTIALPDDKTRLFRSRPWYKKILRYNYELVCRILANKNQVLVRNAYFPNGSLLKLVLNTQGAIWPCSYGSPDFPDFPIKHEARAILGDFTFGDNEFEKMIAALLPFDLPQNAIEGYGFLKKRAEDVFVSEPQAVMSSVSWGTDNIFQVWAAGLAEKGIPLLGVQHGGGYGLAESQQQEDIELAIVDKYYSWGWKRSGVYADVKPMPAPKLVTYKTARLKKNNGILFATSIGPRFLQVFPESINYWDNTFSDQAIFLSRLSGPVSEQIRIRPHREDLGWDVRERIKDQFPRLTVEDWSVPFACSLRNCSLYVADNFIRNTTFLEALGNNCPAIVFTNTAYAVNAINKEVRDLVEELKRQGVVFTDPVKAADQINAVYDNLDSWWNEPERQRAIKNFLERFGRTSADWLQDWTREIQTPRGPDGTK